MQALTPSPRLPHHITHTHFFPHQRLSKGHIIAPLKQPCHQTPKKENMWWCLERNPGASQLAVCRFLFAELYEFFCSDEDLAVLHNVKLGRHTYITIPTCSSSLVHPCPCCTHAQSQLPAATGYKLQLDYCQCQFTLKYFAHDTDHILFERRRFHKKNFAHLYLASWTIKFFVHVAILRGKQWVQAQRQRTTKLFSTAS